MTARVTKVCYNTKRRLFIKKEERIEMTTIKKLFLAVAFTATVAFGASSTDVQAADLNVKPVTDIQKEVVAPTGVTTITAQTDAEDSSFRVSYSYSGTDTRSFDVFLSQDPNTIDYSTPYNGYTNIEAGVAYVSGVQAGTKYYVSIVPRNGWGDDKKYGTPSNVFEVITRSNIEPVITYSGAAGTNSIQLNWEPVAGATGYIVGYSRYDMSSEAWANVTTEDCGVVLQNLDENSLYKVSVRPYCVSASGAVAEGTKVVYVTGVKVKPTKCTAPIVKNYFSYNNSYSVNTDERKNADGYQYEVDTAYKSKDTKVKIFDEPKYSSFGVGLQHSAFKKNNAYKVRVRAYVIDSAGAKQYSEWSGWTYIGNPKTSVKSRNRVITASWAKLKGTNRAVVSISKSKNSGYKKVTTTTKNSVKITKCGKQRLKGGQYYYVTVVLQKKVGKKYVNLDEPYYYQIYISKY